MRSPAGAECQAFKEALDHLGIGSIRDDITDALHCSLVKIIDSTIRSFDKKAHDIVKHLENNRDNAVANAKLSFPLKPKNILTIGKLLSLKAEKVVIENDTKDGDEMTLRDLIDELSGSGLFSATHTTAAATMPVFGGGGFAGLGTGGGWGAPAAAPAAPPTTQTVNPETLLVEYKAVLEAFLMPSSISNSASVLHVQSKHRKKGKTTGIANYPEEELYIAVAVRNRMTELASDRYLGKFRYSNSPEKDRFRPSATCQIADAEIVMGLFLFACNKLHNSSGMHFSDIFYAADKDHATKQMRETLKEHLGDPGELSFPCIVRVSSSPLTPQFSILMASKDVGAHDVSITEHKIHSGRQNCFHAIIIFLVYLGVEAKVADIGISAPLVVRDFYRDIFGINNTRKQEEMKKELFRCELLGQSHVHL